MEDLQARVAGIVLAAGTSSRMGTNKLLLEIDGVPLVRRVVKRAIEAELDQIVVVTGHESERVARALERLTITVVRNPDYENGMTTSLQAGLADLSNDVDAALMILGDMPNVTPAMMAELAKIFRSTTTDLVLSRYATVNAPPTLFGRALFPELRNLPVDRCPRSVIRRHREDATILDWPESCLKDLDRPEDLTEL